MAFSRGPRVVRDGLVLALDAANTKSYPGSGTNWKDLSGNGNNGTLVNGPTFNSDNLGTIVLDGSNDIVTLGDRPSLRPSSITHCAWVKAHSFSNWHGIITNMPSWGTGFSMQIGVTQNIALMVSGSYLRTSYTPSINTWYFICGTHDSSTTINKLYVNGVEENSSTRAISYSTNAVTTLGAFYSGGSLLLDGELPFIMTYNRALSHEEIIENYNATKSRYL